MEAESTISLWRQDLQKVLEIYERYRPGTLRWLCTLFLFFCVVNGSCYLFAMVVAFPALIFGVDGLHYLKVSIPVAVLGSLFDSASFFLTLFIIRRALTRRKSWQYLAHLSVDLLIAAVATFWVLFVFVVSGWFINLMDNRSYEATDRGYRAVVSGQDIEKKENLKVRKHIYEQRVIHAVRNPIQEWRNLFFGIIMGLSAMIPTLGHLTLFGRSIWRHKRRFT